MIITKVVIDNFKIYKHQEFEFNDNKLILITGANGFGKTTVIDAIEWCLTGDIARLKKCYEERNTTQLEKNRAENKKGIIKNSNCNSQDIVKVMLTLKFDNKDEDRVENIEANVFREQKEDSLYIETELKFEGTVSDEIKKRIKRFAANNKFYNYHVCDMYKSYDFMNSKRQEVKEQFEDFIKPHPLADSFSKKLTKLQEELNKEIINNFEKSLIPESTINNEKNLLESIKSELKKIDYPQIKIYEEENLNIEKEKIEIIEKQLDKIKKCGYNAVASKIKDIVLFYEAKEKSKKVDELVEVADNKESDLHIAIKNSYYSIEKLEEIDANIKAIADEKRRVENAKELSEMDTTSKPEIYIEIADDIKIQGDAIKVIEAELKKKQDEIQDKEKGNEIITALSNLIVGRDSFIKYKNEGNNQCPLCGSDKEFSKVSQASELAVEAEAYLNKSESNLAKLKINKQETIDKIKEEFEQFRQYIFKHLEEKLKVSEEKKKVFEEYYIKTKDFFDKLKEVNIFKNEKCIENIRKNKAELAQLLLNEKNINSELDIIKNILTVLQYSCSFDYITADALKKVQIDMNHLRDESISVTNFTFDVFSQKLLFVNNILYNNKILEKELLIKKYEGDNTTINKKITDLKGYIEKAKTKHDEIEKNKADIEKLELKAVGPYLYRIFTKVIKHTIVKKFDFNRDGSKVEGGATFTDQDGNNILNILSQGQFGVFMLSYFFANMFKRKYETEFKTYFVDDITSCMDDMNILSFTDIIKYQLYQKDGVINQFFFSTCNDDLEKLFIHKMKSFNIKFINIKFKSYGRGEIQNSVGLFQYFGNKLESKNSV